MKIADVIAKMISFSNGNLNDINHFLKVYTFAKTIGEKEQLDFVTQETLEIAAVVHDIACPLCREKYGNTNGKAQEAEGPSLAEEFLRELGCAEKIIERVCFLVGHHHTYEDVDDLDYQILLEADFLVNAEEGQLPKPAIEAAEKQIFKTPAGRSFLCEMYLS